jgi:hypothetical protein
MNRFKQETYRTQHNIQSHDYWTPPEVFENLDIEFDIDVASPVGGVDWIPTKKYFTEQDDGLEQDWEGTVWMNPPYGKYTEYWLDKFIKHNDGIALVFIKGRLFFYKSGIKSKHSAGNGSILIACGEKSVNALQQSNLGWFVKL